MKISFYGMEVARLMHVKKQREVDTTMKSNVQLGFHYFGDTKHYTRAKLNDWMKAVGGKPQWVCLKSSCSTAIPEVVLQFCSENGISPLVQFDFNDWHQASAQEFISLLQYYKKHGVEYIQLDGYLNQRSTWAGIKEKGTFLSHLSSVILEFHKVAQELGFFHVLPKLVPGGDYWDLVVLKYLLQQFKEQAVNLDILVMSFMALFNEHVLLWGMGGKRKWTEPQPYQEKFNGEDHRGFIGFEWYQEVAMEELGKTLPVLLLETGQDLLQHSEDDIVAGLKDLLGLLNNDKQSNLFENVIGVCLAFDDEKFSSEVVPYLTETMDKTEFVREKNQREDPEPAAIKVMAKNKNEKCISHYLLLPQYEWGISPWHLEIALPFIRKYKPTIGYSLQEAMRANFVTVLVDEDVITQEDIEALQKSGCKVAIVHGDGTEIAAKLAIE